MLESNLQVEPAVGAALLAWNHVISNLVSDYGR